MSDETCPRRIEDTGPDGTQYGQDGYTRRSTGKYRQCTYCGSMHPDDFMAAASAGVELGVTDKDYKVYVDGHSGKFYFQHLSPEQRHEFIGLLNVQKVRFGWPGHFMVLPYFMKRAGR